MKQPLPNLAIPESETHAFREPPDLARVLDADRFLLELVYTQAFQRLRGIRFLGAIDYCRIPSPNGKQGSKRYTRFEHSLGVLQLAQLYCSKRELNPLERRLACAAALLHDIGHPPLSHSMEAVFKEFFGIDHHSASEDIICGRVNIGEEVFEVLRRYSVNVEKLVAIISGQGKFFERFFGGPINFDTIEGILRCKNYTSRAPVTSNPEKVTMAAIERVGVNDQEIVDGFWRTKDLVYKSIVNSVDGVVADFSCKLFLRNNINKVDSTSYFLTERQLFRKLPYLRQLLISGSLRKYIEDHADSSIAFVSRHYFVNEDADFFSRDDDDRYRQQRKHCSLNVKDDGSEDMEMLFSEQGGILFDEDSI